MIYMIFRAFLLLIYILPFRVNALLGKLIGSLYYHMDRHRRRFVKANISVVFGNSMDQDEINHLGRESCEVLAMNILDLMKMHKAVTPYNYKRYIDISGIPVLMKSIKKGNGTLAVMGHFGNFFLVRYACYLDFHTKAVIIRKLDNPYLERFVNHILESHHVITIRPDGALKKMHRLLLNNAVTVTLADQKAGSNSRGGRHGIVADFFGIPSQTHVTAPLLARRTNADIMPVFVIRKGPGRYRIEINEPVDMIQTEDEQADLKKNIKKLNMIFEGYIKRYPEQWFWVHRRWKDVPGLEGLYDTENPLKLINDFRNSRG